MKSLLSPLKSTASLLKGLCFKYWYIPVIVILTALCFYFYHQKERVYIDNPVFIPQESIKKPEVLQDKLNISQESAKEIVREVEKAKPIDTFTVSKPSIHQAAEEVNRKIVTKDESLPPSLKEKSDRTVITENNTEQKVDVYKINLKKNTKIKVGASVIDGDKYANIALEHKQLEITYHKGVHKEGVTAMYTIAEW